MIKAEVDETGFNAKIIEWPPRLDMDFAAKLEQLDWMIIDVGDASVQTGIVGYLHGRFIPSMRLLRADEGAPGADLSPAMKTLFGAHEVGYPKDILRWSSRKTLQEGVRERILRITDRREYISNASHADRYFQSAAMRKDGVFVSYTERDGDIASGLLQQIKTRFQEVFDYRDPKSIPPGSNWMEEMFRRLAASAVGIPLLSKQYFESSYCPEEAQRFMDARARKRMHVVPIKLHNEPLDLPDYLQNVQYIRLWEHDNESAVISELLQRLPS
jgi:hypothetical protein